MRALIVAAVMASMACAAAAADMSVAEAKKQSDGRPVTLTGKPAIAGDMEDAATYRVYVQEPDQPSGIAALVPVSVIEAAGDIEQGQKVNITGTMATVGGERCIRVDTMTAGSEFVDVHPIAFEQVGSPTGLCPFGVYIKTWGKCLESPAGQYEHSFQVQNASGTFEVTNRSEDGCFLFPEGDTCDAFVGALGRDNTGKARLYYNPPYWLGRTGTVANWYGGYQLEVNMGEVDEEAGTVNSVDAMAPYHTQWMPVKRRGTEWYLLDPIPEQHPAVPFKCRFRINTTAGTEYHFCWITDYMSAFATDPHPTSGQHVTNPVTFTWTKPAGGPYSYQVVLFRGDYTFIDELDAGKDSSSLTCDLPGAGQYRYWVRTLDGHGNSANGQSVDIYCD